VGGNEHTSQVSGHISCIILKAQMPDPAIPAHSSLPSKLRAA
jgi:hypothetical protein